MASSKAEQAEQGEGGRMLEEEEELEDRGHRSRRSHQERRIVAGDAQEQQLMLSWPVINRAQEAGVVRLPPAKGKAPRGKVKDKEAEQQLLTMILETMKRQQARKVLEIIMYNNNQTRWQEEKGNRKREPRVTKTKRALEVESQRESEARRK